MKLNTYNIENLNELTKKELQETSGGIPHIVVFAIGWVVSEIIQGVYQAQKKGWECSQ